MKQFMFTIGCDPEVFLQDKLTDKYKSAVDLIGGTKHNPKQLDFSGNALLEDNVTVEFNTQPANNYITFEKAIKKNLQAITELLPNYKISQESAVSFPQEELETPQANIFGCEPDYNAYTKKINPPPYSPNPFLRSAGGHIHIGHPIAKKEPEKVIQACDLFLGIPSILLDPKPLRRELYGKSGAYRKKSYGVEYRSLSNFWIFNSTFIEWVYTQVSRALSFVDEKNNFIFFEKSKIIHTINNSDMQKALEYATQLDLLP